MTTKGIPLFVIEPTPKKLADMTDEEIEALADEMYEDAAKKVRAHRKAISER